MRSGIARLSTLIAFIVLQKAMYGTAELNLQMCSKEEMSQLTKSIKDDIKEKIKSSFCELKFDLKAEFEDLKDEMIFTVAKKLKDATRAQENNSPCTDEDEDIIS
ncbi:unnamed protein product [Owenia fusiformis]|uniref:Uncharacterized protein n=1 Tax=Owenia fusiformis TaxID=6347 RepID=A0A8S4P2N7_OWEFU|nr:unnamed protein product [Owenia fusiformis]